MMKHLVLGLLMVCSGVVFAQSETDTTQAGKGPAHPPTIVVKAPLGQKIELGKYSLVFKKVVDSRCPADVTCVWAGNVKATIDTFMDGRFLETKEITLGARSGLNDIFSKGDFHVKAHSVTPYPKTASGKIAQEDYILNLVLPLSDNNQ